MEAGSKPLAGVRVGAQVKTTSTPDIPPATITDVSDENGVFRLTGLKPGSYILMILSSEWVTIGDSQTGVAAREIQVRVDETVTGLKVSAVKGGVITGRVSTQEGQPLIWGSVTLTQVGQVNRGSILAMMERMLSTKYMTDDRGVYRIYGLQPGSYLVSVGSTGAGNDLIPLTYYPDGSEKGKPVTVKEAEEVSGIDLVIRAEIPTYTVAGIITDIRTKKPVPNVPIRYATQSSSGGTTTMLAGTSDAKGAFVVSGLKRGSYKLLAGGNADGDYYSEPLPFDILDHDVGELELKVMVSASISGRVVVEQDANGPMAEIPSHLFLRPKLISSDSEKSNLPPVPIPANGEFKIAGLGSGKIQLLLSGEVNSHGWWMTGVTSLGVSVTSGISFQGSENIKDLRIGIKRGTSRIKGRVILPDELLRLNIKIYVVAVAEHGAVPIVGRITGTVGSDGVFEIAELLPGSYVLHLVASNAAERVAKMLSRAAQSVLVSQGGETGVTLTVPSENR